MLVALDAGHGKNTAGKRSPDESFFEYEFNRDVVKRIAEILEKQGIKTILTADTLADVPLSTRVSIANVAKADIFVSIHANAVDGGWSDASGWEIWYSKGSPKGKQLAESIHKHSLSLGVKDRGLKDTTTFTVVKDTSMPAVLIEHGFYTNQKEVELLKSNEFRQLCAVCDAKGILEYFGKEYQEDYKTLYEQAQKKLDQIKIILSSN